MRLIASALFVALGATAVQADPAGREKFQPVIDDLAKKHDVPASLIHRIIMRESRYAPHLVAKGNYGLMQIKPATARGMGYQGAPAGLLDGKTNLTYAVPYLANAYRLAGRNADAAVRLYAGGYYYVAKRKGLLAELRTAHSPSLAKPEPPKQAVAYAPAAQSEQEPESPIAALFRTAKEDSPAAEPIAVAPEPAAPQPVATTPEKAVAAPAKATTSPTRAAAKLLAAPAKPEPAPAAKSVKEKTLAAAPPAKASPTRAAAKPLIAVAPAPQIVESAPQEEEAQADASFLHERPSAN